MDIQTILINKINPAKYNPRKDLKLGDPEYEKLKKSLTEFDLVEPLIWNKRSSNLVGGHQRLKILQERGDKEVEVSVVDLSPTKEKALNLALNKISGEWDYPKLKDILEELDSGILPDIEITGFDDKEIEALMTQFHVPEEGLTPDDEIPEKVETVCKKGDLWKLGEHRLLCGDATVITDVERLMGGEKAVCMWTDPPYGVKYVGKTKDALTIDNDDKGGLHQLLTDAFSNAQGFCVESGHFYIAHPPGVLSLTYGDVIRELGWRLHETLVWVKDSMVLGHTDYHYRHEPIYYGYFPGDGRPGRGKHDGSLWVGNHSQTTVFEVPRPKRSESHPTMKPVKLIDEMLQNNSPLGGIVLDLFGGSGSTLIACEKLGRRCYMMEIDEHYCDVIIQRWQNFTGKKAELING